jgi:hypothetical protein
VITTRFRPPPRHVSALLLAAQSALSGETTTPPNTHCENYQAPLDKDCSLADRVKRKNWTAQFCLPRLRLEK